MRETHRTVAHAAGVDVLAVVLTLCRTAQNEDGCAQSPAACADVFLFMCFSSCNSGDNVCVTKGVVSRIDR